MHPVLFRLGQIPIYTYGFLVSLGVVASISLMRRHSKKEGWTQEEVTDLALWFTVTSFIGARVFYVVQHLHYFLASPLAVFRIWEGGIVFYGGAMGALAFLAFYARAKGWPFLQVTDFLAPYVFLAHAFGRMGCFMNGCCYGVKTGLPWAVTYPFLATPVHPVQIYSSVFNVAMFFCLLRLNARKHFHSRRRPRACPGPPPQYAPGVQAPGEWPSDTNGCDRKHRARSLDGETTTVYFLIYGAGRFLLEYFRGDNPRFIMGLTLPQLISAIMVVLAVLAYLFHFRPVYGSRAKRV